MDRIGLSPVLPVQAAPALPVPSLALRIQPAAPPGGAGPGAGGGDRPQDGQGARTTGMRLPPLPGPEPPTGPPPAFDSNLIEAEQRRRLDPPLLPPAPDSGAGAGDGVAGGVAQGADDGAGPRPATGEGRDAAGTGPSRADRIDLRL